MYYVYLLSKGSERVLLWSGEDKLQAAKVADAERRKCRKADPDGVVMDISMTSDEEQAREKAAADMYAGLTEEERRDVVEIEGQKFAKAILRERAKAVRKKTGLTQAGFAARYKMSKRTIEEWERGTRTPQPWVLHLLERVVAEDF